MKEEQKEMMKLKMGRIGYLSLKFETDILELIL